MEQDITKVQRFSQKISDLAEEMDLTTGDVYSGIANFLIASMCAEVEGMIKTRQAESVDTKPTPENTMVYNIQKQESKVEKLVMLGIRVPPELRRRIKIMCAMKEMNMDEFIIDIIEKCAAATAVESEDKDGGGIHSEAGHTGHDDPPGSHGTGCGGEG